MEPREDQIKRAYEDLRTARVEMHEASEKDLAARTTLKTREAARLEKAEAQLRMDLAIMRTQELQWLVRNDQATADLDARGYVA